MKREEQLELPLEEPKPFQEGAKKKAQAIKAEGCPYHNGRFEYNCHICNPR